MAASVLAPAWSMLMMGMLSGLPVSMPPLEEDPALAQLAPAECLWYTSTAGMATPNLDSDNKTERLFAEPELHALFYELETQLLRAARREANAREERMLVRELPELIKSLATKPLAAYVADFQMGERGPKIQGGIAIKTGDQTEEFAGRIERLLPLAGLNELPPSIRSEGVSWTTAPLPPGAPQIQWGHTEDYFLVAVGEGEAERLLDRLQGSGEPPAWLTKLRNELPVERRSTTGYLNVAGILERIHPMLPNDAQQVIQGLGINEVQAIYTTTGLGAEAAISRAWLELNGPHQGVFALLPHKPLKKSDLQLIPRESTFATAVRLDVGETLEGILRIVDRFEPRARNEFEEELWEMESELRIDVRRDLLASLDDTWLIYMPQGELMTAWTGVTAAVGVKDSRQLEDSLAEIVNVARREMSRGRPEVLFQESRVGDHTIHYIQVVGEPFPFTPAWCVTEDYLLAGLSPQSIKTALARGDATDSLADLDVVAEALSTSHPPASLSYVDTERLFRAIYPMAQFGLSMAASEMAREGIEIDLAALPATETIAQHLSPTISTWSQSPDGFRMDAQQAIPGGDFLSSAPVTIALLLPAIQNARFVARETQEMNTLKQIGLAMHNHHEAFKGFPNDIVGEDGKPLLSWRVKILPFIEENQLYDEFHLDEPWDSPHNAELVARMPAVYASPTINLPPGRTVYLRPHGKNTLHSQDSPRGVRLADTTDGTSNTIMVVRGAPSYAVQWSKPTDIDFDPRNPQQGIHFSRAGTALVGFADGSVRRLSSGIRDEVWRNLILRNDGNPIDYDEFDRPRRPRPRWSEHEHGAAERADAHDQQHAPVQEHAAEEAVEESVDEADAGYEVAPQRP